MADATHKSFDASDRSYYAIIKKEVHNLALSTGFPEKKIAELDIIVAEITSNLHKYAKAGELLLSYQEKAGHEYIELISIDSGPGMQDLSRMMADGYSSTNTIGHGLGSIKRLSDEFDIFSSKGWGTILVSRVFKLPITKAKLKAPDIKAIVVAKPGEIHSGDGYYVKASGNSVKLMLADGLGHGVDANYAMNQAVAAFQQCPFDSPVEIIRFIHRAVRKTRGLVATFVVVDTTQRTLRIAGVGNISAKLIGPLMSKTPLAYNGIIGHNIPNTMNDQLMSINDFQQLVLCSDGIRSRWELNKLPGLNRCDLSIQAAAIYKDHSRRSDDMSVVISKF
ncbi:serine/threonine protein kinase [Mucilaginibacter limnophilus]|uniref:Serine/threonine protein kinase n=1 Tax=Mucilaginibacter limnophilus TaxID=1932778 RepID=A0A3S2V410_9SPHI|nr:SpoIIE family protein phosphatase [Mucilaginibacter limnophilus]RVU02857.1 serine/threonine protein kinase [Mucilaginibacter limnophilus]